MNILITGVHGFVGSYLVKIFDNNKNIYGLDIVSNEKSKIVKTISWSELNKDTLPEIDVIIHLAGKAHDTQNKSDAKSYFEINTGLTKIIFDKFITSKASQFIFFSSVKAAADVVKDEYLTEEVTPEPVGPYGESKKLAEDYILDFLNKDDMRLRNKSVIVLRPCMIHGPGNKGNLNLLYKVVSSGMPWPMGSFNNKRSITSIDNLCFLINKIIDSEIPSGIYNIADDEPISTNRIIELICETRATKSLILKINPKVIKSISMLGDILKLPINSFRLQKLTENYIVSNKKIKEALNIDKLPVSAEEGLLKTFKSFIN